MNRKESFKENSPVRKKSRNEKFHKLFKIVPDDEYPIDYFSCAFISDNFILLQGNLYISQNWFCFYSKIRGRGRLLQIPMEKVISITREKTALVFPNAIGFQTAEEKYVFGSFLSRDSTYKFLVRVWKHSTDKSQDISLKYDNHSVSEVQSNSLHNVPDTLELSKSDNQDYGNNSLDLPESPVDIDCEIDNDFQSNKLSESNCSSPNQNENSESDAKENMLKFPNEEVPSHAGQSQYSCSKSVDRPVSDNRTSNYGNCDSILHEDTSPKVVIQERTKVAVIKGFNIPFFIHCFDCHKMYAAFSELLVKLQKIPRNNLLLAVCLILVLFLLLSAFGLTYKILVIQAKMEATEIWSPHIKSFWREGMYSSLYNLNAHTHIATVKQLHEVLLANMAVLQEVSGNLKNLQSFTSEKSSFDTLNKDSKER